MSQYFIAAPGAIWCISCWGNAPRQDLLDGLDPDKIRIIVLDKNMANSGVFKRGFGKITWIWGELLNFGGNEGMYGWMDALVNMGGHLKGDNGKTLRGYASESEGLDSNPVFYDLFTVQFFLYDIAAGERGLERWLADSENAEAKLDEIERNAPFADWKTPPQNGNLLEIAEAEFCGNHSKINAQAACCAVGDKANGWDGISSAP